jgi:hypothetical protein
MAIRSRVARLLAFIRRYGVRSASRRLLVSRTSPLLRLTTSRAPLAHVTRVDRSSARLVIHGRVPAQATQLKCSAVVPRHLDVTPVDVTWADGVFEVTAPLRHLSSLDGVCETRFVLSDGSDRWIMGRAPRPDLYLDGLVAVPITVVALPGGTFMRLRVKSLPDGELRLVSERISGKVAA